MKKYFIEEAKRAKKAGLTKRQFLISQLIVFIFAILTTKACFDILTILIILFEK